jgi:hypothetical protein
VSRRRSLLLLPLLVALALAAFGCNGGDDGDDEDGNGEPTAAATASGLTEADAEALLSRVLLDLSDVPSAWAVMGDDTVDNASAIQANPDDAALVEECERLLSRTVTYQPEDVVNAFLGGETLALFSTATVYASEAGADACAQRTGERLAEPGALARQFGGLFVDPQAVVVQGVEWPQVGDVSFAATLTGQIEAAGTMIDLTILVVGFKQGNVTAAVGSARSGAVPPREELEPYVDLVVERISEGQ